MTRETKKQKRAHEKGMLERQIYQVSAQLPHRLATAFDTLEKAGEKHLAASAVIVELTVLGGRKIAEPFAISDGLSDATIAALKADIVRAYKLKSIYHSKEFKAALLVEEDQK